MGDMADWAVDQVIDQQLAYSEALDYARKLSDQELMIEIRQSVKGDRTPFARDYVRKIIKFYKEKKYITKNQREPLEKYFANTNIFEFTHY